MLCYAMRWLDKWVKGKIGNTCEAATAYSSSSSSDFRCTRLCFLFFSVTHHPCAYSMFVPPPPALPTLHESRLMENAPSRRCWEKVLEPPMAYSQSVASETVRTWNRIIRGAFQKRGCEVHFVVLIDWHGTLTLSFSLSLSVHRKGNGVYSSSSSSSIAVVVESD